MTMDKKRMKELLIGVLEMCKKNGWDYKKAVRSIGTLGGG